MILFLYYKVIGKKDVLSFDKIITVSSKSFLSTILTIPKQFETFVKKSLLKTHSLKKPSLGLLNMSGEAFIYFFFFRVYKLFWFLNMAV